MKLQLERKNPARPSVVKGLSGSWLARAYDPAGEFQIAARTELTEAFRIAERFAAGDFSEAAK